MADEKYSFNLSLDLGEDLAKMFEESSWLRGVVNKGESFMKFDGKRLWNRIHCSVV